MERRLATRHADRRHRPQLPRAIDGLEVRLLARRGRARRTPGRNERVQNSAAAVGQGPGASRAEADAAVVEAPATYLSAKGRIVLSAVRQLRGNVDDRVEPSTHSRAD